jgi:hypothetical protein
MGNVPAQEDSIRCEDAPSEAIYAEHSRSTPLASSQARENKTNKAANPAVSSIRRRGVFRCLRHHDRRLQIVIVLTARHSGEWEKKRKDRRAGSVTNDVNDVRRPPAGVRRRSKGTKAL